MHRKQSRSLIKNEGSVCRSAVARCLEECLLEDRSLLILILILILIIIIIIIIIRSSEIFHIYIIIARQR
jgi:hypothetical protein